MCQIRNARHVLEIVGKSDQNGRKIRMDSCMKRVVDFINVHDTGFETLACCCGHGRYPPTLLVRANRDAILNVIEIFSGIEIPRTRNFYRMDEAGYYFIPETLRG